LDDLYYGYTRFNTFFQIDLGGKHGYTKYRPDQEVSFGSQSLTGWLIVIVTGGLIALQAWTQGRRPISWAGTVVLTALALIMLGPAVFVVAVGGSNSADPQSSLTSVIFVACLISYFIWALTLMVIGRLQTCPHCRSRIEKAATVCRHCGRDLVEPVNQG